MIKIASQNIIVAYVHCVYHHKVLFYYKMVALHAPIQHLLEYFLAVMAQSKKVSTILL